MAGYTFWPTYQAELVLSGEDVYQLDDARVAELAQKLDFPQGGHVDPLY